jgi:hypothetical protein
VNITFIWIPGFGARRGEKAIAKSCVHLNGLVDHDGNLARTPLAKNSACRGDGFPYSLWAVAPILRFIGLLNAAVWLGAMVLFTAFIGPGLFSPEMKQVLRADWMPGAVAQILVVNYMMLQQWCAGIALVHLVFDWLYTGKIFAKSSLIILVACLLMSLAGTRLMAPKMKELHLWKYSPQATPAQRDVATRSFPILHAAAQITNLLALCGVLFYYWRLSVGPQGARSGAAARYRS